MQRDFSGREIICAASAQIIGRHYFVFRFKFTNSALVNSKNNQSKLPPELSGDSELEPELEALELELEFELELEELELELFQVEGFAGISSVKACCPGTIRMGSSFSVVYPLIR